METRQTTLLLSTAYFPPVMYFSLIIKFNDIYIEKYENYSKQSYRNRCNILSANGVLPLVIPVKRPRGKKTPVKEIKPDNSYNWQRLHRISIESAYRSSPFFEYYFDDIRPFFEKRFDYLLDLNTEILDKILTVLQVPAKYKYTKAFINYVEPEIYDLREGIHPKRSKNYKSNMFQQKEYVQVFGDRHGFRPNLTILDLLFNTGPDAREYLAEIRT